MDALKNKLPLELILPEAVICPEPLKNKDPVINAWDGVFVRESEPAYGKPTPPISPSILSTLI